MPAIQARSPRTTTDDPPRVFDGLGVSAFAAHLRDPLTGDWCFSMAGRLCNDAAWSPDDRDATGPVTHLSLSKFLAAHGEKNPDLGPAVDRLKAALADVGRAVFRIKGYAVEPPTAPPGEG